MRTEQARVERIDFYILASAKPQAAELFACRLAEKAYAQDHRIFIRTRSRAQAESLDELLWTFRQSSFLPHGLVGGEDEPILLGDTVTAEVTHDLLINLSDELPPHWERFRRLAEVVEPEPALLAQARERFRFYRRHGYQPISHNLGSRS